MKRLTVALLCAVLLLQLAACGGGADTDTTPPAEHSAQPSDAAGQAPLASFTTSDLDGNEVDETILADHPLTMVYVWATFCNSCIKKMPDMEELRTTYADQGVQFLGIPLDMRNSDGTFSDTKIELARDILAQSGLQSLQLLPSDDLVAAKLGEISAVPMAFFTDAEGNLIGDSLYVAARTNESWSTIIDALLLEVGE